jgi:hypothetical protein
VAGVPEVDVLRFDVPAKAFRVLPVREALQYGVLPLGEAQDQFFVASSAPTDEDLRRKIAYRTGRNITLVWAAADAIATRLELQSGAFVSKPTVLAQQAAPLDMSAGKGAASDKLAKLNEVEMLVSKALVELSASPEQE